MFLFKKKEKTKMIDSKDYLICPRCGEPMKTDARCCLKCGALNYEHPDNSYMKSHISEDKMDKINREKFEKGINDSDDGVYVGGKKLEEVSMKETPVKENRKIISIPTYLVLLVLLIVVLVWYLFFY